MPGPHVWLPSRPDIERFRSARESGDAVAELLADDASRADAEPPPLSGGGGTRESSKRSARSFSWGEDDRSEP